MAGTRTRGSSSEATEAAGSSPLRQDEFEPGSMVGRYRVEAPIGAGGMGIVVAARDPELDRPVAIKIMHHVDGLAERWLRREAQALAQLNHPSIVGVLDVGTLGERPFIAMELIDGVTLRTWLDEKRRSTKDILTVFTAAGRGLAAAHRARITHCDFKPSNVMICRGAGETARLRDAVRIMDFGLARQAADEEEASSDAEVEPYGPVLSLSEDFTGFDKVRGTPKYMAPEQFALESVGPPADQYSFCVALYEALWGSSPFEGESPAVRMAERMTGAPPLRPSAPRSQRALVAAVLRGLAPLPEDRWPSMDALLDALEPTSRMWLWGAGLASVAALGVAALFVPTDARCIQAGSALEGVWNDTERESVAAGFDRTGRPFSADLWKTTGAEIDGWAASWIAESEANCRATYEGGGQSERDYDARLHCLERQTGTLGTVLRGLRSVDADSVGRALDTIEILPDPAGCTGDAELAPRPSDPERVAALDAGHAAVDACRVLSSAGHAIEAMACAREALVQARDLDEPHLLFHARRAHAAAVSDVGKADESLGLTEALYFDAQAAGLSRFAARTATTLAFQHTTIRNDVEVARRWLRRADTLRETDAGRALCVRVEALIERRAGNDELSIERAREAVAIEERRGSSKRLGVALNTLATALSSAGNLEDARQTYDRSLQVHQAITGGAHDSVATAHNNLGTVLVHMGQLEASVPSFERALEIRRGILPREHRHIATATANIGESHARLGRYDRALPYYVESAEVFEAVEGRQSADHAIMRVSAATALRKLDRLEEARESLDIALGVCRHLPLEDDVRFEAEQELALLEEASGNPEAAVAFFESALEAPLRKTTRKTVAQELERLRGD